MSSILTNTSAMVALQTLKSVNSNLAATQNEISTGKSVSSAKDNAAVWSIAKVMESDVKSFDAISESLELGESTVAVARQGAETVTDLLTNIKGKIVAAQEENVDRAKIQSDIQALTGQIASVVGAAQFNGLNMLEGTETVSVLSSLDRANDGSVSASFITAERQDLTTTAGVFNDSGTDLSPNAVVSDGASNALNDDGNTAIVTFAGSGADYSTATATIEVNGVSIAFAGGTGDDETDAAAFFAGQINALGLEGISASASGAELTVASTRAFEDVSVGVSGLTGDAAGSQITELNGASVTVASGDIAERAENVTFSTTAAVNEGDGYRVTFNSETFTYVAGRGETMLDVANGLKAAIDAGGVEGISTRVVTDDNGAAVLKIDNDSTTDMTLAALGNAGGEASGGLFGLDAIDVTTEAGARAALDNIEVMINTAIDSAAEFGSTQGRIQTQSDFVSKLSDALVTGIGSLVDADMEEASARLTALQTQQQLAVQSLSIANQAPQTILALFR